MSNKKPVGIVVLYIALLLFFLINGAIITVIYYALAP